MPNLYQETKAIWNTRHSDLTKKWALMLQKGEPKVLKASKDFNEWRPLRFYLSVGEVGKGQGLVFSLRYRGQEVANVVVRSNQPPVLVISENHARNNKHYFGVITPAEKIPWKEASEFRAIFKDLAPNVRVKSQEHEIEAKIIEDLEKETREAKFNGSLGNVRHCGFTRHEYPIQYPLPISAHTGTPKDKIGHIDILVRHGSGRGTRLSIWELKKPGMIDNAVRTAVKQAYIYATTVAFMLRSPAGLDWYKLWGFNGSIPKKLNIEAVVVLEDNIEHRKIVDSKFKSLQSKNITHLVELETTISLHALFYRLERDGTITMKRVDYPVDKT